VRAANSCQRAHTFYSMPLMPLFFLPELVPKTFIFEIKGIPLFNKLTRPCAPILPPTALYRGIEGGLAWDPKGKRPGLCSCVPPGPGPWWYATCARHARYRCLYCLLTGICSTAGISSAASRSKDTGSLGSAIMTSSNPSSANALKVSRTVESR
jgi:hypothetical protein